MMLLIVSIFLALQTTLSSETKDGKKKLQDRMAFQIQSYLQLHLPRADIAAKPSPPPGYHDNPPDMELFGEALRIIEELQKISMKNNSIRNQILPIINLNSLNATVVKTENITQKYISSNMTPQFHLKKFTEELKLTKKEETSINRRRNQHYLYFKNPNITFNNLSIDKNSRRFATELQRPENMTDGHWQFIHETVNVMQQHLYAARFKVNELDPIFARYYTNFGFRIAFIMGQLDEFYKEMHAMFSLAYNDTINNYTEPVWKHIVYYRHIFKTYINIVYTIELILDETPRNQKEEEAKTATPPESDDDRK